MRICLGAARQNRRFSNCKTDESLQQRVAWCFEVIASFAFLHGYRVSDIIQLMAIRSFRDSATEDLFHGRKTSRVRRFPSDIVRVALRKLDVLNGAHRLDDLRSPPANRLEALRGDLAGFYSIRVNDQWRLIFRWEDGVHDVSLTDYH